MFVEYGYTLLHFFMNALLQIAESLSSVDFLKLWPQYDTDDNDYIEKTELDVSQSILMHKGSIIRLICCLFLFNVTLDNLLLY